MQLQNQHLDTFSPQSGEFNSNKLYCTYSFIVITYLNILDLRISNLSIFIG